MPIKLSHQLLYPGNGYNITKSLIKNKIIIKIWVRWWILAVYFLHKKFRFAPPYTGEPCTIWEYRGGGGIHPVDANAVAHHYQDGIEYATEKAIEKYYAGCSHGCCIVSWVRLS